MYFITYVLCCYRENEAVKNIDMLHAPDYSAMGLNKLVTTIQMRKKVDSDIKKNMRYSFVILVSATLYYFGIPSI